MNFLKKMAGKSCLVNMRFDVDHLLGSIPNNPAHSSMKLRTFVENATMAAQNWVSKNKVELEVTLKCGDSTETLDLCQIGIDLGFHIANGRSNEAEAHQVLLQAKYKELVGMELADAQQL